MTEALPPPPGDPPTPDNSASTFPARSENLSPPWKQLIVSFNNTTLPGYSKDSIVRLGVGEHAGVNATGKCIWGPHTPPRIELRISMRDGSQTTQIARVCIKLQSLVAPAEFLEVPCTNTEALERLFNFTESDLSGIRDGPPHKPSAEMFDELYAQSSTHPTLVEHFKAISTHVVHIRCDIQRDDMIVLPSKWFLKYLEQHSKPIRDCGNAILDLFAMTNMSTMTLGLSFPFAYGWSDAWDGAFTPAAHLAPFEDICANVRGTADDLALKNIDLTQLTHPISSNAATDIFLSREHRTVALLVGSVEELDMQQKNERKLYNTYLQARAFADIFSCVKPSSDDTTVYGIPMDGTIYSHQYFVIPLLGIEEYCPDIGSSVSIYASVEYTEHKIPPNMTLSAAQKLDLSSSLESELRFALRRAEAAQERVQAQVDTLLAKDKPDNTKLASKQSELRTIFDDVYFRHAERSVFPYITEVVPEASDHLPNEDKDVQLWYTAHLAVLELRQQENEDDIAWASRLLAWVSGKGAVTMPGLQSELGDAFRAIRIPLPHGVCADVALFSAYTPSQSNWLRGFRKPPTRFHIPYTPLTGNPQKLFSHLFDERGHGTNSSQTFIVRIWHEESDTTTNAECHAVTQLNGLSDRSRVAQWWDYIVDFANASRLPVGNLLAAYPELASRLASGKYANDPDTETAMKSLESSAAGFVLATGCPGAGKSTWATEICDAVMAGQPNLKSLVPSVDLEIDTATQEVKDALSSDIDLKTLQALIDANDSHDQDSWDGAITQHQRSQLTKLLKKQSAAANSRHRIEMTARKLQLREEMAASANDNDEEMATSANDNDEEPATPEEVAVGEDNESREDANSSPDGTAPASPASTYKAWALSAPASPVDGRFGSDAPTDPWASSDAPTDPWAGSDAPTDPWASSNTAQPQEVNNDSSGDPWGASTTTAAGCDGTQQSTDSHNEDASETDAELPLRKMAPGWAIPTTGEGINLDKMDSDAKHAASKSGRCVWVTPTNRLAWDAQERLARKSPEKKIIHVFPWKRELANLLDANAGAPPALDEDVLYQVPWQNAAMARHVSAFKLKRWNDTSPAAHPWSLSEFARSIAIASPSEFSAALSAIADSTNDKTNFRINRTTHMESARELLEFALSKADCIVGTPVAVSELAKHIPHWRPDLVVVDEAGRLNESALMIPIAEFTDAPFIIIGDPNQCTPFNRTDEARDFDDLFGKQRKTSLLDRISLVDGFDITLTANHRSHASVVDWAQQKIYHGRMKIVNQRSSATREMSRYIQTLQSETKSAIEGNSVWIDVECGIEELIGTSYINPTNALIVRELAVQLYRDAPVRNMVDFVKSKDDPTYPVRRGTIMIITGYANQKRHYEAILDEISDSEVPKGFLTVRTIDDSVSAEADIVIIDLVRTSRTSFLQDRKRIAVMTTRARLASFIVGSSDTIRHHGLLGDLFKHHKEKQAVLRIKGEKKTWSVWCNRCQRPGHTTDSCKERPQCLYCKDDFNHAGRNCPYPCGPSEIYDNPIGDLDTISRTFTDLDKSDKARISGKRANVRQKHRLPDSVKVAKISESEKRYRYVMRPDEGEDEDEDEEGDEFHDA